MLKSCWGFGVSIWFQTCCKTANLTVPGRKLSGLKSDILHSVFILWTAFYGHVITAQGGEVFCVIKAQRLRCGTVSHSCRSLGVYFISDQTYCLNAVILRSIFSLRRGSLSADSSHCCVSHQWMSFNALSIQYSWRGSRWTGGSHSSRFHRKEQRKKHLTDVVQEVCFTPAARVLSYLEGHFPFESSGSKRSFAASSKIV